MLSENNYYLFAELRVSLSGEECSFRGTSRLELMKNEKDNNVLSLSKSGPQDLWPGISNYVLQVLSKEKPHTPLVYLYFLDSGGGTYPEVISTAQADWFKRISEELNPDSRYKNGCLLSLII